jgi:Holliday junction DNA helicase RuvA
MIGLLTGTLARKTEVSAIIDCHGVGYVVAVSSRTRDRLPAIGGAVTLEIHTHVREDALSLFGFFDAFEKEVFELLLTVSGVGPKMAMNVLSGISAELLVHALVDGDIAQLTQAPGVGKKTAERLIVELRAAAKKLGAPASVSAAAPSVRGARASELASALLNLGYRPGSVEQVVESVLRDTPDIVFEDALRESLRRMAR